jgi:thioredoxin-related protein
MGIPPSIPAFISHLARFWSKIMSKMLRRAIFAVVALLCIYALAPAVHGEEGLWKTDFEAAKTKAKAEKKFLLVDFTGSDWCVWCKRLKAEVFDKDQFQNDAPKHFVLVELDYPAAKKLPDELRKQNETLRDKYKIRGYPTVLLMDPQGQVVAQTGYRAGGPEGYVKQLSEFMEVYATVGKMKKKLASAKGLDRAKLLDKLVDAFVKLNNEVDELADWSKEIVKLDADNKAGLCVKHEFRLSMTECKNLKEKQRYADAKAAVEKALALEGISAAQKQQCYMAEGELCFLRHDFPATVKCLQRAIEADPQSGDASQAKAMIERFKPLVDAQEAVVKLKSRLDRTEGLDRAKLLDKLIEAQTKLLPLMPSQAAIRDIEKWSREIVALDTENKAGLKSKYEFRNKLMDASAQIRSKAFDKARATLAEAAALPGLKDDQKKLLDQLRGRLPKEKVESASN